jgi:hypothetical protein
MPRVNTQLMEAPPSGAIHLEDDAMADRRAGKVPHVKTKGGGTAPRSRNQDGSWRKKRSDTKKK